MLLCMVGVIVVGLLNIRVVVEMKLGDSFSVSCVRVFVVVGVMRSMFVYFVVVMWSFLLLILGWR